MANVNSTGHGSLNEKEIHEYQKTIFENSKLVDFYGKRSRYYVSRGFCYVGTKLELIAEGLAQDGWFPGDTGNNKTSLKVVFHDSLTKGVVRNDRAQLKSGQRCLEISRAGSKNERFRILDMFPLSIRAEYRRAEEENWKREKEAEMAQEEHERAKFWEQYKLERRVSSVGEARTKVSEQIEAIVAILNGTHKELCDSGYVQTDSHIKELNEIVSNLNEAFKNVTFDHDPELRIQADLKLKHKTAKTDLKFNDFLNCITQSNVELGE